MDFLIFLVLTTGCQIFFDRFDVFAIILGSPCNTNKWPTADPEERQGRHTGASYLYSFTEIQLTKSIDISHWNWKNDQNLSFSKNEYFPKNCIFGLPQCEGRDDCSCRGVPCPWFSNFVWEEEGWVNVSIYFLWCVLCVVVAESRLATGNSISQGTSSC